MALIQIPFLGVVFPLSGFTGVVSVESHVLKKSLLRGQASFNFVEQSDFWVHDPQG